MSTRAETAPAPVRRTAWARNLAAPVRDYLNTETGSAVVLLGAALAALLWANSPGRTPTRTSGRRTSRSGIGDAGISQDLRQWVNEGLMTFFFLVLGLEAKRELDVGALRERRRISLPITAALGGMALPVLIFLAFNAGGSGADGWGAAMSTDTAFALGVLALVAPGGTRLRVRLLTLVVFDDLIALLVIATVYTDGVSLVPLAIAVGLFGVLFALRYASIAWRGAGRRAPGRGHLGRAARVGHRPGHRRARGRPRHERISAGARRPRARHRGRALLPRAAHARARPRGAAQRRVRDLGQRAAAVPPASLDQLRDRAAVRARERRHPPRRQLLEDAVTSPITLGILFGYVVGKPLGILGAAWLATAAHGLHRALSWPDDRGRRRGRRHRVHDLAPDREHRLRRPAARGGEAGRVRRRRAVALVAWVVFRVIARLPAQMRARQLAGTADELADLAEDVDPDRDHIRGPDDAPVTLVEYGDYECPYCGQAEVVIRELLDSFGDDLRYVWRTCR